MSEQIDAIYDHGVLKPSGRWPCRDKARVKVTVDMQLGSDSVEKIAGRKDGRPETGEKTDGDAGADFDAELDPLLFDGPSLPPDFSRADIYADHDCCSIWMIALGESRRDSIIQPRVAA